MKTINLLALTFYAIPDVISAFTPSAQVGVVSPFTSARRPSQKPTTTSPIQPSISNHRHQFQISAIDPAAMPDIAPPLGNPEIDFSVIALVAGQENYGFALVALGEALWSFSQAPSFSHAKILVPAALACLLLIGVSGPMVTNASDPASIRLGLEIATGTSVMLGASYVARLLAPYSPSSKEIAFLGLLVSVAGFFSFSQNLFVDGFISLPTVNLPSLPGLPSLPSFEVPKIF